MILIFTEALSNTGLGHLGRCTALAEILIEKVNSDVNIVLHSDHTFPDWEYPCPIHKVNWKEHLELLSFLKRIKDYKFDVRFYIDSYLAELQIYNILKENCRELICIDDDQRLDYPKGSTILNPGYPGLFLNYNTTKYNVITGKDEVLLRKPFREKLEIPNRINPPKKILITLGGADPKLYSNEILHILVSHFPHLEKYLLIGPGFTNEENLKKIADQTTYFYKNLSALEMRDLMLQMDFAITAGGQTTYELDRCHVPIVILKTAENQSGNIRGFVELQWVREIKEPREIISVLQKLESDSSILR